MTENTDTPTPSDAILELAAETMRGDLVSALIDELKAAPDCWPKLSQRQQEDVIRRITERCEHLVDQVVNIIAADGRQVITSTLEQITAKDGIKAVCVLGRHDPNRHELLDAVGKAVLIVVADSEAYQGGELPKGEADQRELLGDGDTPVADNTVAAAA